METQDKKTAIFIATHMQKTYLAVWVTNSTISAAGSATDIATGSNKYKKILLKFSRFPSMKFRNNFSSTTAFPQRNLSGKC